MGNRASWLLHNVLLTDPPPPPVSPPTEVEDWVLPAGVPNPLCCCICGQGSAGVLWGSTPEAKTPKEFSMDYALRV